MKLIFKRRARSWTPANSECYSNPPLLHMTHSERSADWLRYPDYGLPGCDLCRCVILFLRNSLPSRSGYTIITGTLWCSWLRNCATSRKVAGSIRDRDLQHYGLAVELAAITNEYQDYLLRGGSKGSQCLGLTTLPPLWAKCRNPGSPTSLEP
jgi:hypothetical protein